jgi:hypothetical protein
MTRRSAAPLLLAMLLSCGPAFAQESAVPLDDEVLAAQRGGLLTPLGLDIGFGASVRTYVDGSLALETRLIWTAEGVLSERMFESEAAKALTADLAKVDPGSPVSVAPGTTVIHDLSQGRIASIVLNTANDRNIRQDTDVTLHLPQLPDLQQRVLLERLSQALQALSPDATGLGR